MNHISLCEKSQIRLNMWVQFFFKCTKILSQHHFNFKFFYLVYLPCKGTFMDDYGGIYNCNGLKYIPLEIFEIFLFIIFYGDQNIG